MELSNAVLAAALGAALMNAGWNSAIKLGGDKMVAMALTTGLASLWSLLVLPWLDWRAAALWDASVWWWLAASVAVHTVYHFVLPRAYQHGEFGVVYPVARGSAPLFVTLGAALLAWVHVTEAYGFLRGYRRYAGAVSPADADRYYDEYRRVAEALGAVDVPRSEAEVAAYFCARQPELRVDERSREVLEVLSGVRLPVPVPGLSREVFLGAGAALLPDWAEGMLERSGRQRAQAAASAKLMQGMAPLFRRALPDGLASRACARMGVPVSVLREWPTVPR